jgi:hypothetical protein
MTPQNPDTWMNQYLAGGIAIELKGNLSIIIKFNW